MFSSKQTAGARFQPRKQQGPVDYGQPKKMSFGQVGPSGGAGMGMAMRNANVRPQTPAPGMSGPNQAYKTNMRGFDEPDYNPLIGPYGINADWMQHPRPYFPPPNAQQQPFMQAQMPPQGQEQPTYMPQQQSPRAGAGASAGIKVGNTRGTMGNNPLTRGIGPSSPYQAQLGFGSAY